jgi:hypothetical protein
MGKVLVRKMVTARELPREWLGGRAVAPETPLTVTVELEAPLPRRRLVDSIGAGRGAFASPDDVDAFIRRERDAWAV